MSKVKSGKVETSFLGEIVTIGTIVAIELVGRLTDV